MSEHDMSEKQTAGHTPGPWVFKPRGDIWSACKGFPPQWIAYVRGQETVAERRSNAHLIAAAPDLLAALHMVETRFGYTFPREEREQIRAALAKAKGERP